MREILFRGKDKYTNEWRFGGIVHQTDFYGDKCDKWFIIDGTETQDYDIGYEYEVIPETAVQFTGLYDKNNQRIFEHDIVKICSDTPVIALVRYIGGAFEILWSRNQDKCIDMISTLYSWRKNFEFEVIGNLFDNPDLLSFDYDETKEPIKIKVVIE